MRTYHELPPERGGENAYGGVGGGKGIAAAPQELFAGLPHGESQVSLTRATSSWGMDGEPSPRIDVETESSLDTSPPEPKDDLSLAYYIFLLQGIGQLFPWNAFISATEYFGRRFCGTPFAASFENYFSVGYNLSSALGLILAVKYQAKLPQRTRVLLPLGMASAAFVVCMMMVLAPALSGDAVFGLTMVCLVVAAFSVAMNQSALFGMAARFPARYTQAVFVGQGVAGLVVALAGLLTTAAGSDSTVCPSGLAAGAAAAGHGGNDGNIGGIGSRVAIALAMRRASVSSQWLLPWGADEGEIALVVLADSASDNAAAATAVAFGGDGFGEACPPQKLDASALAYFGVAAGTLLLCIGGFLWLERLPLTLFYLTLDEDLGSSSRGGGGGNGRPPLSSSHFGLNGSARSGDLLIVSGDMAGNVSPASVAFAAASGDSQSDGYWGTGVVATGAGEAPGGYGGLPVTTSSGDMDPEANSERPIRGGGEQDLPGIGFPCAFGAGEEGANRGRRRGGIPAHSAANGRSGSGEIAAPVPPLLDILSMAWSPAASVVLVFAITLSVFPGSTSKIISQHRCQPGASRSAQDLYIPLSFVSFNFFDFAGRVLAGWRRAILPEKLWAAAAARTIFVPLFLACAARPSSRLPTLFVWDGYFVGFMALFALSNGYISSLGMMGGPEALPPGPAREAAGTAMVVCLNVGLLAGSLLGFATLLASTGGDGG